jgi:Gpi18-like mannosyltransferase
LRFRSLLLVGIAVRLAIAPFFAHPADVYSWFSNGQNLFDGSAPVWSFLSAYKYAYFLFVFPAYWAYAFFTGFVGPTSFPMSQVAPSLQVVVPTVIPVVPGLLFDFLVKLPLVASDALVAYLLYRIGVRYLGDLQARSVALLWFLNPLTIWVSSGWGMFDTLPTLFTVAALYLLLGGKYGYSAVSLVVAAAFKYYAIVMLVPFFLFVVKEQGWKSSVRVLSMALAVGILLLLPNAFSTFGAFSGIPGLASSLYHYSGISIWTVATLFLPKVNPSVPAAVLIACSLAGLYFWTLKKSKLASVYSITASFVIPVIPLLMFFPFVGENFVVWCLPFLAILALANRRVRLLYWAISIVALVSSVTNSLLPYYMLPLYPWIGPYLVHTVSVFSSVQVSKQSAGIASGISVGKVYLALVSGTAFAVLSATLLTVLKSQTQWDALAERAGFSGSTGFDSSVPADSSRVNVLASAGYESGIVKQSPVIPEPSLPNSSSVRE